VDGPPFIPEEFHAHRAEREVRQQSERCFSIGKVYVSGDVIKVLARVLSL